MSLPPQEHSWQRSLQSLSDHLRVIGFSKGTMLYKNLTLRWGEHYPGLADNHLRISLQHREGLQRFLSILKQLER